MTLLLDTPAATVLHGDWRETLALVTARGGCDALIVDAPYSARTHAGHNGAAARDPRTMENPEKIARCIAYPLWSAIDVAAFVAAWAPVTRGWFVSLTDHVLAPAWEAALQESGRYVFSPIACVETGSRIRLVGDGPSQWSTFAIVARPRDGDWLRAWRESRARETTSLPGAYVGAAAEKAVVGGKPLWLMSALCRDYSRKGDIVCDPCAGAGTTGVAARTLGRRFIGGDALAEHAALAARNVGAAREQLALFDGAHDAA